MKSNEFLEEIHSGEIEEESKINVMYNDEVIDTLEYIGEKLISKNDQDITKYLCDIEADFEVDEEDEEDEIEIEEKMYKIGEYVDIQKTKKDMISSKEQNGYGEQYFSKEEIRFRVLYIDEERKKVICIADTPTKQELTLEGKIGYENSIYELNRICQKITGIETARNLTKEDIEKSEYLNDKTKKELIFGQNNKFKFWLASCCVNLNSSRAIFGVCNVYSGSVYADTLYTSNDYSNSSSYALRPVVEIDLKGVIKNEMS